MATAVVGAAPPVAPAAFHDDFWVVTLPKWNKSTVQLVEGALSSKQTLKDVDFEGKRALVRVDYNVPFGPDGKISDTSRIDQTKETLQYLLDPARKVKCVVLVCHLGRPGGQFKREEFSLRRVVDYLSSMLKRPVVFLDDCVGPDVVARTEQCAPGTVFLLENLRFHIEECGDAENREGKKITADKEAVQRFREALTKLGDVFVFEAFGAAHRPHSSVVGVKLSQRVAGCLLQREMDVFSQVLERPKRPYLAVIGGAKVSDKIGVIMNMLDKVDEMIIGGGMAYTFKKVAEGVAIGKSLFDVEGSKKVQEIVSKARQRGVKLHFPVDHVVASAFKSDADKKVVTDAEGVPAEWLALDVGPASQALFAQAMARAQTIVWNGPLGKFEWPAFADGTRSAMHNMVLATRRGATTVIGGGDTGAAAWQFELDGKPVGAQVTHVSTGGGSTLVLLEGMMLPGIDVLSEKAHLPPPWASLKDVYLQLQLLRQDNAQLREELRSLKKRVEPVLPPEKKDKEKKDK